MCRRRFLPLWVSLGFFTFILAASVYSGDFEETFHPAKVKDISDRKYEPAVIELLDNAKDSIVISMYSITTRGEGSNPVKLLLNDLLEARQRGVSVTLHLNTCFYNVDKDKKASFENPIFKRLEDAGCVIHLIASHRRLHDKLIVVDNRYVVEGSANWSISALRNNLESSTLIDSPALAKKKLNRLKSIITPSNTQKKISYTPSYIENLPKNLTIPKSLLLNKKYFPAMLTNQDSRAMDLYLLLLAHSRTTNKQEFFISLEAMALSLGMSDSWTDSALRRQVIKTLKKLQKRYRLIKVSFFHGRDANVMLTDISGDTFAIPSNLLIQPDNAKLTMCLKFLFLIQALLKEEGEDLYSILQPDLAKRFSISVLTIKNAFNDLREYGD